MVVATGAEARELGVPGEAALRGRGVSYCATCDGMLYRGREVAIVGGGNTAVGDALTLARLAGRVTLIHRRDALRASAVYLDKLRENGVNIVWNTEVKALQGDDRLTGLVLRNKVTGRKAPCRWTACLSPSGAGPRPLCSAGSSKPTRRAT